MKYSTETIQRRKKNYGAHCLKDLVYSYLASEPGKSNILQDCVVRASSRQTGPRGKSNKEALERWFSTLGWRMFTNFPITHAWGLTITLT